jgi:hypothetical protein
MTLINEFLLELPNGLQLYMKRNEKRLDGITLRHIWCPYPVFDITASNPEKSRTDMVPNYLFNYFCRYYQQDYSWTDSDSAHSCPPLLSILFVAEGARKGSSLQELLDEKMSAEGLAQIGKGPTLEERLTTHFAKEKAERATCSHQEIRPPPLGEGSPVCKTGLTSLNTVHYPVEAAPIRVSERIAAIEARVSSNSSSSNSASASVFEPIVVVRANLTYSPTPCRLCKTSSTFFVDTGGDWDCINCVSKGGSLTTEQRTLLERLGPDPTVKVDKSFPLAHHPFVGLYKNGIECCTCHKMCTLAFDRLFDKPWSYCAECTGFEIVQRSTTAVGSTIASATVEPATAEVLARLKAKREAQRAELKELRRINIAAARCKHLQGRIDHRKSLISSSAEDLKKKEQALTEELAALDKTATQIRVVRELEKKVEEARKTPVPTEDLKKKEAALTEELAALEKIAAEVRVIRELEKRVIEARKILQEPECK